MEFKQITDLVKLVSKSGLIEFRLKEGDFEISMLTNKHGKASAKQKATPPSAPVATPAFTVQAAPPAAAPSPDLPSAGKEGSGEAEKPQDDGYLEISSPMVGTFYRSSAPDKPPFVKVGDTIAKGDVVCIIEAMKLYNEIESEISGTVVKVVVEDATPVEYDQVLFLIEP